MEDKKSLDRRSIAAIILIIAGGLLLLDTFDIINFSLKHIIFNWKTLLIAIGLVILFSSENKIPAYVLIGLGIVFWLPSIGNYNIRLHQVFWPLVLIGVGVVIISRRSVHAKFGSNHPKGAPGPDGTMGNDYIDDVSIFGGGIKRYSSQNLKGGNITAIFGGSEIDLTSSQMSGEGTVIDVFTMFGGTKLIVPATWRVKSEATSLFGGFSDKRFSKPDETMSDKVLLIKGVVLFGGVEIKSY